MLKYFFSFCEQLVVHFTWIRLSVTLVLVLSAIGGLLLFESYTNHFALARLEREADLLSKLIDISDRVHPHEPQKSILEGFESLAARANAEFIRESISFPDVPTGLQKGLYALFPWVILAMFVMIFAGAGGRGTAVLGMLLCALPLAFLGSKLPTFEHFWINKWLYPWSSIVLVVALVMYWQRGKKKPASAS